MRLQRPLGDIVYPPLDQTLPHFAALFGVKLKGRNVIGFYSSAKGAKIIGLIQGDSV
jgi:hypothetical protein